MSFKNPNKLKKKKPTVEKPAVKTAAGSENKAAAKIVKKKK